MKPTGLKFQWDPESKKSKNENAIAIFKERDINWEYNHSFELTADFYGAGLFEKIDYISHGDGIFEIVAK